VPQQPIQFTTLGKHSGKLLRRGRGPQDSKVAATADVAIDRLELGRRTRDRSSRLSHGVREGLEVVDTRNSTLSVDVQADDLPAARRGQAVRVALAEVVGVRLGVRRERSDHGRRVGIDISERRDR